jgi:hypothetical protein
LILCKSVDKQEVNVGPDETFDKEMRVPDSSRNEDRNGLMTHLENWVSEIRLKFPNVDQIVLLFDEAQFLTKRLGISSCTMVVT